MPRSEAALLGLGRRGENLADRIEGFQVCGGIRARRSADRRLVDHLDGRDRGVAFDAVAEFAPGAAGALRGERFVEHVVDERRFAGTGNAGDGDEHAERDRHVDAVQIVAVRAENLQEFALRLAAPCGNGNAQFAAEIAAGERLRVGEKLFARAGKHQVAAVLARAGSEIEDEIGGEDRIGIVLDDQQRVAEIAQAFEDVDQAIRVARVQADRRLVEHVERADEMRAERRGKLDALRLATRERGCEAVEREVVETDLVEKAQALLNFFEDLIRDHGFSGGSASGPRKTAATSFTVIWQTSVIDRPATFTARASARRRVPRQSGHVA